MRLTILTIAHFASEFVTLVVEGLAIDCRNVTERIAAAIHGGEPDLRSLDADHLNDDLDEDGRASCAR